jgi:hypothetical protein
MIRFWNIEDCNELYDGNERLIIQGSDMDIYPCVGEHVILLEDLYIVMAICNSYELDKETDALVANTNISVIKYED